MRSVFVTRFFFALAALTLATLEAWAGDAKLPTTKIENFTLKSHFGKEYALRDLADRDVVVVAFLGTECPLAKLYAPRLAELSKKWGDRVAFLGIDSNQQDSLQELAAYAQRHELEFPLLKDPGNAVADQFGAERTPEVFVLDKQRAVRYRGRIDDQYGFADGVGYQRPSATRNDLAEAVNQLLAGEPVSVPTTKSIGCLIGRVRPVNSSATVTYSNQVARVFQQHCVECHRPNHIGPFSMASYSDCVGWGEMIREVVDQGRMPPWHAAGEHGKFKNDLRLSAEEKNLIVTWVNDGCPEGDAAQLPPPRDFVAGWGIGEPDQIIYASDGPVDVPAEGVVDYHFFSVDPGWTEDKWIMAAEARPESVETVHHILVFVAPPNALGGAGGLFPPRRGRQANRGDQADEKAGSDSDRDSGSDPNQAEGAAVEPNRRNGPGGPGRRGRFGGRGGNALGRPGGGGRGGEGRGGPAFGGGIGGGNLIAGYAPGMNPMLATDGSTAMHVRAGSKLIFQLHYTPNGKATRDRSYVGFRFADPDKVKFVARSTAVANPFFAIPAGDGNYEATAESTFEYDSTLSNMTPHMHTRGKSFRYEVTYPDGQHEVLLDVPAYDFNWQTTYNLAQPKLIPKGSTLLCTAHWDNSENNLSNPDPSKTVTWGDQTWEEMMIGFYVEVFPKGQVPESSGPRRMLSQINPEKMFRALDANKDGKLTEDELPDRIGERMSMADVNHDGSVSQEELTNLFKLIQGLVPRERN